MIPLVLLLLGCQGPIGADRHDLVANRIAAVTVGAPDDAGRVEATAWLVVDGRTWSDEVPFVAWRWLDADAPDVWAADFVDAGRGAIDTLKLPAPNDRNALGLVVTFPDGTEQRALVELPVGGPVPLPPFHVTLGLADAQDVTAATPDVLAREARLGWTTTPADSVPLDRWARLEAVFEGGLPSRLTRVRWTATAGTFLELDGARTDWAPARLWLDDLELTALDVLDPGPVTVLALALDDAAGTVVAAREVWVGAPEPGVSLRGRWIGVDEDVGGASFVRGQLTRDDDAPTGFRLVDVKAVDAAALPAIRPWGEAAEICGLADAPFDPSWLFQGRCRREDLEGYYVVGEVDP